MSDSNTPTLLVLPIEVIFRILDQLQPKDIFLSIFNVCGRLNAIIDAYHPYQVNCTTDFVTALQPLRSLVSYKNASPSYHWVVKIKPWICALRDRKRSSLY